jgi:hypothetical protein
MRIIAMPTRQMRNSSKVKEATQKRRTPRATNRSPVALTQQADLLVRQRVVDNPGMASHSAAGNRAVSGLLVQAKLVAGPVGDRYEREANRVVGQVMSMQLPCSLCSSGKRSLKKEYK